MAGIYLHIPFCKQACHYCNFHFSTNLNHKDSLIQAMLLELEQRKGYIDGASLDSIYLGGGTPSLLTEKDLNDLLEKIYTLFSITENVEITLEANPDDLDKQYLKILKDAEVNRLSIGIQSFFEEDLLWMNRAHDSMQALDSLENAKACGFENISIDLIYGGPTTPDENWQKNLDLFFQYQIPHLSSYAMTVESGTALGNWVAKGKVAPLDPNRARKQFEMMVNALKKKEYRHYEISNFAKPGFESKHNANYWKGVSYLGIGPAAHSFNGKGRQWNISHNPKYIAGVKNGSTYFEQEILSPADRYNEYMMTGLRCDWGVSEEKIKNEFPNIYNYFLIEKEKKLARNLLIQDGDQIKLTNDARFLADGIASDFFFTAVN